MIANKEHFLVLSGILKKQNDFIFFFFLRTLFGTGIFGLVKLMKMKLSNLLGLFIRFSLLVSLSPLCC